MADDEQDDQKEYRWETGYEKTWWAKREVMWAHLRSIFLGRRSKTTRTASWMEPLRRSFRRQSAKY